MTIALILSWKHAYEREVSDSEDVRLSPKGGDCLQKTREDHDSKLQHAWGPQWGSKVSCGLMSKLTCMHSQFINMIIYIKVGLHYLYFCWFPERHYSIAVGYGKTGLGCFSMFYALAMVYQHDLFCFTENSRFSKCHRYSIKTHGSKLWCSRTWHHHHSSNSTWVSIITVFIKRNA